MVASSKAAEKNVEKKLSLNLSFIFSALQLRIPVFSHLLPNNINRTAYSKIR